MPSGKEPRSFGRSVAPPQAPPKPNKAGTWASMKEAAKAPPKQSEGTAHDAVVAVGDTVMHAKFGKGKVVELEGSAPNEKATVFFPSVGQKQLLLKFAKLDVIG